VSERKLKGECPPFDYEPHTIRIRSGENNQPFFTEMNPNRKVPVIVDSNAVTSGMEAALPEFLRHSHSATVFESGAILMYLAERYDDLLPKSDIIMKYKAIEWTFWGSTEFSIHAKQFGEWLCLCLCLCLLLCTCMRNTRSAAGGSGVVAVEPIVVVVHVARLAARGMEC